MWECKACDARDETIRCLREEIQFLRTQLTPSIVQPTNEQKEFKPVGGIKTWNSLRKKLETKYKKPEDKVEEYWKNKNHDLEQEAFQKELEK